MIRAYRTYDEIKELLNEQQFEPTALIFSDTRVGTIHLKVSGIQYGATAIVTYYAMRLGADASYGFPTLRDAFKHLGIE